MNSNTIAAPQKAYAKPELVSLGTAQELTQAVNVVGGGDAQFAVLNPS